MPGNAEKHGQLTRAQGETELERAGKTSQASMARNTWKGKKVTSFESTQRPTKKNMIQPDSWCHGQVSPTAISTKRPTGAFGWNYSWQLLSSRKIGRGMFFAACKAGSCMVNEILCVQHGHLILQDTSFLLSHWTKGSLRGSSCQGIPKKNKLDSTLGSNLAACHQHPVTMCRFLTPNPYPSQCGQAAATAAATDQDCTQFKYSSALFPMWGVRVLVICVNAASCHFGGRACACLLSACLYSFTASIEYLPYSRAADPASQPTCTPWSFTQCVHLLASLAFQF